VKSARVGAVMTFGVVFDGAERPVVKAVGVVGRLVAVTGPIVLKALTEDALVEGSVRAGLGASGILLVAGAADLCCEGVRSEIVAGGVAVVDARCAIQIVVLDLFGDGLGAVGPVLGITPVADLGRVADQKPRCVGSPGEGQREAARDATAAELHCLLVAHSPVSLPAP